MMDALQVPISLEARIGLITVRRATLADCESIISLLSDDPVSASRGDVASPADHDAYRTGLAEILADAGNDLLVAVDSTGAVVGSFQLTAIPGMSRRGARRLLVEAVRVRSDLRSAGIGSAMMRWVMETAAPAVDAGLVQLTSDLSRSDAHRFYENLGFAQSHAGFKYAVAPAASRTTP